MAENTLHVSQDIKNMAEIIAEAVPAEKIYLFGSYAYGTPHKDSDYDFFIVIPDGIMRPIEAVKNARRALASKERTVPIDVMASTNSNFIIMKNLINSIEKVVSQKGVLLFERQNTN